MTPNYAMQRSRASSRRLHPAQMVFQRFDQQPARRLRAAADRGR